MNEKNLILFTAENQPPKGSNSRKGCPNRSTLLNKWLKLKIETGHPTIEGKTIKVSMHDVIILSLIDEARKGNIKAIIEIQDTVYGKLTDKSEIGLQGDGLLLDIQAAIKEIYGETEEVES